MPTTFLVHIIIIVIVGHESGSIRRLDSFPHWHSHGFARCHFSPHHIQQIVQTIAVVPSCDKIVFDFDQDGGLERPAASLASADDIAATRDCHDSY
jgi:hypothetical protein